MGKASISVLISEDTNRTLLLLRPKDDATIKDEWTFVAGTIEGNEDPLETIKREIMEELMFNSTEIKFKFLGTKKHNDLKLYYFIGFIRDEETPIINEENADWGWFNIDNLPKNTYIDCRRVLKKLKKDGFFK